MSSSRERLFWNGCIDVNLYSKIHISAPIRRSRWFFDWCCEGVPSFFFFFNYLIRESEKKIYLNHWLRVISVPLITPLLWTDYTSLTLGSCPCSWGASACFGHPERCLPEWYITLILWRFMGVLYKHFSWGSKQRADTEDLFTSYSFLEVSGQNVGSFNDPHHWER